MHNKLFNDFTNKFQAGSVDAAGTSQGKSTTFHRDFGILRYFPVCCVIICFHSTCSVLYLIKVRNVIKGMLKGMKTCLISSHSSRLMWMLFVCALRGACIEIDSKKESVRSLKYHFNLWLAAYLPAPPYIIVLKSSTPWLTHTLLDSVQHTHTHIHT